MDRPLGIGERLQLKLHVVVCTWCVRYLDQINFMRQLLRSEMPNQKPHTSCKE
jgi:hypothetical protein